MGHNCLPILGSSYLAIHASRYPSVISPLKCFSMPIAPLCYFLLSAIVSPFLLLFPCKIVLILLFNCEQQYLCPPYIVPSCKQVFVSNLPPPQLHSNTLFSHLPESLFTNLASTPCAYQFLLPSKIWSLCVTFFFLVSLLVKEARPSNEDQSRQRGKFKITKRFDPSHTF